MQDEKHVILCVDDDPDILETLKIILENNGYVFVGVGTAEDALKKYDSIKPDLMIVDLMMEEVDAGTGLVNDLKARGINIPIYMMSSVGDALNQNINYTEIGLAGVFQKPVNSEKLISTLKKKLA